MRTYWLVILFSMALGLTLRFESLNSRFQAFPQFTPDERLYYISTAVNAVQGKGFVPDYQFTTGETFIPPPLQSLYILPFVLFGGAHQHLYWAFIVQVLLGGLLLPLLGGEIGRRAVSPVAGAILSLLLALLPEFCRRSAYLGTEANYLVGLSLLLFLLIRWTQHPSYRNAMLPAVALGILNLQRANSLLLGVALAGFAWLWLRGRKGALQAAIFLTVPFLVLTPWLLRNQCVSGDPVWVSSNGGILFHFANRLNLDARETPYWDMMWRDFTPSGPYLPEIEKRFRNADGHLVESYYRYSEAYFQVAKTYAFHHPFHFLRNYAMRFAQQFYLVQNPFRFGSWYFTFHYVLLIAGVAGLGTVLARSPSITSRLVMMVFIYFASLGALFPLTSDGRMSLFLKLFLAIFAAFGAALLQKLLRRHSR